MARDLMGMERWAVLYAGALGWAPAVVLPYEMGGVMQRFGLTESQAGWMVTGELLALALAALWCSRLVAGLDKRRCSRTACLVAALAAAGAALAQPLAVVAGLKLVAGAAMGVLVACCYGLAPVYRHPERMFAQVGATMAVLYAGVMYLIPQVVELAGPRGLQGVLCAMLLLGALLSSWLPAARMTLQQAAARARAPRSVLLLLAAVGLLFVSQTAAFAFAATAGEALHFSAAQMGLIFTVAMLAQLPAAMFTHWLGERAGLYRPILAGLALLIASAFAMYDQQQAWGFVAGICVLNVGAMLANPYLLAVLAGLDETGRSTAAAGGVTNIGMALGPAIAGVAVGSGGGLQPVGWLCAGLLATAVVLALAARRRNGMAGRLARVA